MSKCSLVLSKCLDMTFDILVLNLGKRLDMTFDIDIGKAYTRVQYMWAQA